MQCEMVVRKRFESQVKRAIDVVGAAAGLVVLSPVLLWAAAAVALAQGHPILFRHVRPGLNGEVFTLIKFRTMRRPRRGEVWYQTDSERVTGVGRFLRSTSIDELPALWNVLRGEMSLVGPRPLMLEYLPHYTPGELRRHEMRPGITGWAIVNGRHTTLFEERLLLDVWYVDNWSLALDFRILFRTVSQVLRRSDVSAIQDYAGIQVPRRFHVGLEQSAAAALQATTRQPATADVALPRTPGHYRELQECGED